MGALRIYLGLQWLVIVAYTAVVVQQHGMNLLPVFFGDMAAFTWPGQFNLDFFCLLTLSALWVNWRHGFSAAGWLLALLALFGGILFLSSYLLLASRRTNSVAQLLIGPRHLATPALPS